MTVPNFIEFFTITKWDNRCEVLTTLSDMYCHSTHDTAFYTFGADTLYSVPKASLYASLQPNPHNNFIKNILLFPYLNDNET